MTFRILLDVSAFSDIQDAFNYYETQKNGLGGEFVEALDKHFKTFKSLFSKEIQRCKVSTCRKISIYDSF